MVCKEVSIPEDGDGGISLPDESGIVIQGVEVNKNVAKVNFKINNTSNEEMNVTVKSTIDVGKTGTVDAEDEQDYSVGPGFVAGATEFEANITKETEAAICVEMV